MARIVKKFGDLTKDPVPRLIRRVAVPAATGLFFNTMYNVVDTYFAGTLSTEALAALSLSMPVFFIILSMSVGMSTGATALVGNALGGGNRAGAREYAIQGVSVGAMVALGLTGLGIYVSPALFGLLGAHGQYLRTCLEYMDIIFLGSVFFMINYMMNAILQAQGDTRSFRNFLFAGFVLNIGLDRWFVFGGLGVPALGIQGIAFATILIQAVGVVYLGYKVKATGLVSNRKRWEALPQLRTTLEMARQGIPASANFLTIGVGVFVIQYFVSDFGKVAVAAYGTAIRIEQIALLPALGLDIAVLAIVSQNSGAGLYDRVREAVSTALIWGGVCMGLGTVAIFAAAKPMLGIFTDNAAVVNTGAVYLYIDALVLYAYVVLFVHVAALQGLKRPMFALWIGLFRQVAAPAAVFYLLTRVLDVGIVGIWWGIFAVTWCAAGVAFFYARRVMARMSPRSEPAAAGVT